ncbi:MAG TPA: PQQ-binding-like beta-propeller repeat protein [Pilimelia sp.]|nr:PQQ-binding-like beta-propeller repeat protein [Pilimelia sp.]
MIDLDLPPPAPAAGAPRPRLAPGVGRPAIAAALLLAVLLTLGGAEPAAPGLRLVLSVGDDGAALAYAVSTTALFAVVPGSQPDSRSELRRYALSEGSPRWAVRAPHSVQGLLLAEAAHVLIATSGGGPEVSFLDADTGRVLWRMPAVDFDRTAVVDTGLLSVITDRGGGDAGVGGSAELRMADLRTGRTIWSRAFPSIAHLGTGEPASGPPTRAVVVTSAGRATVLDTADGAELGGADLGVRLPVQPGDGRGDLTDIMSIDNRLYVVRRVGGATSISAYAGDDLRLRWRVTDQPYGILSACGPVLCLDTGDAIVALDARDGSQRWTDTSRAVAVAVDAPDARAFLVASTESGALDVLDPATGRVQQPLGDGRVVDRLVLRPDKLAPGRTWVAALDADGAFHGLGWTDIGAADGCDAAGRYLACATESGTISVWQLPAGVAGGAR